MSLDVWKLRNLTSGCLFCCWPSFTSNCCNVWVRQRTDDCNVSSQWLSSLPGDQRQTIRQFPIGSAKTKWLFCAWNMPAETIARATKSFRAWCLAGLPGAFLQTKPCSPCASTRISPVSYSTLTKIMHLCCRELNRRTSGAFVLGSRCPIGDIMSGGLLSDTMPAPQCPCGQLVYQYRLQVQFLISFVRLLAFGLWKCTQPIHKPPLSLYSSPFVAIYCVLLL